jgi:predicted MFS family arabinose efflux permease
VIFDAAADSNIPARRKVDIPPKIEQSDDRGQRDGRGQRADRARRDRRAQRAGFGAITTTVVSVMPVFLVGGLAVQVSHDLGLTRSELGLAVTLYFGVTAVGSLPVGGLVERLGPARTGRAAVSLAGTAMLAIALTAHSVPALLVLLAIAATANSLGQLSSNASLAQWVPARHHGLAFGAKQSAIPLATLLAGAAVPVIALTVGWRWAFGLAAIPAFAALRLVPPDPPGRSPPRGRRGRRAGAALVLLGIAGALAAGAANALGTFLVDFAVERGSSESAAGLILTLGSAICVASRLAIGWLADQRSSGYLGLVAALLGVGSVGVALLGLNGPIALVTGVVLAFGLGWSWPGLLAFAVVRHNPQAPAIATSVTQTGVYAGASLGPLGFGLCASHAGYPAAWSLAAAAMALSCAFTIFAAYMVRSSGHGRGAVAHLAPVPGA